MSYSYFLCIFANILKDFSMVSVFYVHMTKLLIWVSLDRN